MKRMVILAAAARRVGCASVSFASTKREAMTPRAFSFVHDDHEPPLVLEI